MKNKTKDKWIPIRATEEQRKLAKVKAKKNGFDSVSQFIHWLIHRA